MPMQKNSTQNSNSKIIDQYYWHPDKQCYRRYKVEDAVADGVYSPPKHTPKSRRTHFYDCRVKKWLPKVIGEKYYNKATRKYVVYDG